MSHWDYRIISEVDGDHTNYFISEVFYNDAGEPKSWVAADENLLSGWDNVADLSATVEQLQGALRLPVLRVFGRELREV